MTGYTEIKLWLRRGPAEPKKVWRTALASELLPDTLVQHMLWVHGTVHSCLSTLGYAMTK